MWPIRAPLNSVDENVVVVVRSGVLTLAVGLGCWNNQLGIVSAAWAGAPLWERSWLLLLGELASASQSRIRRQAGRSLIREELTGRLTTHPSLPQINPICTCSYGIIIKGILFSSLKISCFRWQIIWQGTWWRLICPFEFLCCFAVWPFSWQLLHFAWAIWSALLPFC